MSLLLSELQISGHPILSDDLREYESSREAPHCRSLIGAQNIHEKLGGTDIIDDSVFKPKGMHWLTYSRLIARFRKRNL